MKICARKPFVIVLLQICAREAQIVLQVYWLLFQYTVTSLFGYNSDIFTATTFLWLSIHGYQYINPYHMTQTLASKMLLVHMTQTLYVVP